MKNNERKNRIANIPIALLPTMVGACTLSTVYANLGFTWIKHITMIATTIIWIVYVFKIFTNFDVVKNEYSNTVPASLYAAVTMILMILGSYYFQFNNTFGKALWLIAIALHAIHILVFTYRNVFKGINKNTFVPSWFVTYNGIMVSTVVGTSMNEPRLAKLIVYYGIGIFFIIIPFMIVRLVKVPIHESMIHTQAIVLAPSSLCLVSYLNFIKNPNTFFIFLLYFIILFSIIFIIIKIPEFFSYAFTPGFAGLTFPMAIGIVASTKASVYFASINLNIFSYIVKQISGIQIYITTTIIAFVLYNFLKMWVNSYKRK